MLTSIEVALVDAPELMTWEEAHTYCDSLGNGWRLPCRKELDWMYKEREKIGCFSISTYWSSLELDSIFAWSTYFSTGSHTPFIKEGHCRVRAVRDAEARMFFTREYLTSRCESAILGHE